MPHPSSATRSPWRRAALWFLVPAVLAGLVVVASSVADLRWRDVPAERAVVTDVVSFGAGTAGCVDARFELAIDSPRPGLGSTQTVSGCAGRHQVGDTVRLYRDGTDVAVDLPTTTQRMRTTTLAMLVGGGLGLLVMARELVLAAIAAGAMRLWKVVRR